MFIFSWLKLLIIGYNIPLYSRINDILTALKESLFSFMALKFPMLKSSSFTFTLKKFFFSLVWIKYCTFTPFVIIIGLISHISKGVTNILVCGLYSFVILFIFCKLYLLFLSIL